MRGLLAFVGVLCLLGAVHPADSREAQDYKASEQSIVQCVETAEKAGVPSVMDVVRQCVGNETRSCRESSNGDRAMTEMLCASAEEVAWSAVVEESYALLLERTARNDDEWKAARAIFDPPLPTAVPLLKAAHEAWLAGFADCTFLQAQAGLGTDRYDAPARCRRNRAAERALLYRRWGGR